MVVEVKAVACELPSRLGLPLSRLSVPDIRDEVIRRGIVAQISGATIWRWLSEDAIRPWTHRSWIFPRDPEFEAKAGRVLDLYARSFAGKPLHRNDYVISADEMPSIQALARCHPSLAPGPARAMRVEHEYQRRGTLAYMAAWDVHRAKVFGRCEPTTGIQPFARLVAQVMRQEPYASARRVFWVVDNGSSHCGGIAVERMHEACRARSWCTRPSTRPGSTRLRSTSRLSSARHSPRGTSPTWPHSNSGCSASSVTTKPAPSPLNGSSHGQISPL